MNLKAKLLFAALILGAGFAAAVAHAQNPPGVDPTHYWTYHLLQPYPFPQPIATQDQFTPTYINNNVDVFQRLVNWVYKTDPVTGIISPVPNPNLHYTWWNLTNKYPVNQFVLVTNQFGSYPVNVYNAEFLLAPALKEWPPGSGDPNAPPPVANHYVCYRANGFPSPNRPFMLQDEWRQDQQIPGPLEFLCVPCWKQHNGIVYPPVDVVTHLALYPITPISPVFDPFIIDQFYRSPQGVAQQQVEYLMVPSTKNPIVTGTKGTTWGMLRMLYR